MSTRVSGRVGHRAGSPLPHPSQRGRHCFLCGGRDFRLLHRWPVGDRWNPASIPIAVWQCACGVVLLHPVPTTDQLPDAGDWWSASRKKNRRNRRFKRLRRGISSLLVGNAQTRFVKYTRRASSSGRLLDIGCGEGSLLEVAAGHYECVGLEPSPAAADIAASRGFPIIRTTLEDARIEPRCFDVVTMDSVIEHFDDPLWAVKKVNRFLTPGGVIALKTPKFGGPAYKMHGPGWNGFRHGYHKYLFTGHTLSRTLGEGGFQVLRRPRRERMLDDVLILWGRKAE